MICTSNVSPAVQSSDCRFAFCKQHNKSFISRGGHSGTVQQEMEGEGGEGLAARRYRYIDATGALTSRMTVVM